MPTNNPKLIPPPPNSNPKVNPESLMTPLVPIKAVKEKQRNNYSDLQDVFKGNQNSFSPTVDPRSNFGSTSAKIGIMSSLPILSNSFVSPQELFAASKAMQVDEQLHEASTNAFTTQKVNQINENRKSFDIATASCNETNPLLIQSDKKQNDSASHYSVLGHLAQNSVQLSLNENVPPVSVRRKFENENVQKVKVRFADEESVKTIERTDWPSERKLAPKRSNPSMPDMSSLRKFAEEKTETETISMNCLNPFSPNYCPRIAQKKTSHNPFVPSNNPQSISRLGEDFFSSLFANKTTNSALSSNTRCATNPTEPLPTSNSAQFPPVSSSHPVQPIPNPSGILPVSKPGKSVAENIPPKPKAPEQDKYAALKDLDDLFKSTTIQESESNN